MKKNGLYMMLAVLLAVSVLAGCGKAQEAQTTETPGDSGSKPGNEAKGQTVDIEFWGGWTGPDGDVMRGLVERFNQENPDIKVTLTTLQWSPLFEKLVTQAKAGSPPSLMAMHPQEIAQFASLGILDPDAAEKAGVKQEDFDQNAWNYTMYDGKQYALPLDMHMHGLYINVDMFKAAGLDPAKPPRTAAEFLDVAAKLTIDANGKHPNEAGFDAKNVKQWGMGLPNNHHGFYLWYALMYQQGEDLLNGENNATAFDASKGAKAWEWLGDLVYKHQVVPQGQKAPMDDFKAGLTAMVVDGPWQLAGLEGQNAIQWTTAPFVQVFDEPAVWGSAHILTFPKEKDAKKREAALKLAKWLTDHSEEWAKSGNIPSKLDVQDKIKDMPGRQAFIEMMPYEKMLPNLPKTAQVFSASSPSPIMSASQGILLENRNPADIVKELSEGMNAILSQP